MDSIWRLARRRAGEPADPQERAGLERIIALARVVVAVAAFVATRLDSESRGWSASFAEVLVAAYSLYAVALAAALWYRGEAVLRRCRAVHFVDLVWATAVTSATGGPSSHFSPPLFVFAVIAAAFRWGFAETLLTGAASAVLLLAEAAAAGGGWLGTPLRFGDLVMRGVWLVLVAAVLGYLADREKRFRDEAVIARHRIEAVTASIPVGLSILDKQGGVISVNEGFERVWGGPRPATHGVSDYAGYKAWWMDSGRAIEPEEWASARAVQHRETVVGQALRIARFDGSRAFVLNSAAPVFDAAGELAGSVVIIQDITDRVQAEQDLAASRAALRAAVEDLRVSNAQLHLANETLEQRVRERTVDLEQRTAQLQALAGELTMAEERERRRVAQVIHDQLQQLLAGARINLEVLRLEGKTAPIAHELKAIDDLMAEALGAARALTTELSPSVLYRSGLAVALRWLARWFEEQHGLAVEVDGADDVDAALEDVRIVLFRSVNEALFNVVRHANVKRARMRMDRTDEGAVRIAVIDEGAGFNSQHARAVEGMDGGFGLFGIRERLELLGGRLHIESAPGCGTRVTIVGPPADPPRDVTDPASPFDCADAPVRTETETH